MFDKMVIACQLIFFKSSAEPESNCTKKQNLFFYFNFNSRMLYNINQKRKTTSHRQCKIKEVTENEFNRDSS